MNCPPISSINYVKYTYKFILQENMFTSMHLNAVSAIPHPPRMQKYLDSEWKQFMNELSKGGTGWKYSNPLIPTWQQIP